MTLFAAAGSSGAALQIAVLLGVAVAAQIVAWRLRIPGVVLLLASGLLLGPVLGVLHVGDLLGDALFDIVGLMVGLLLLEGGLELRPDELRHGSVGYRLISIGFFVSVAVTAWVAAPLFGLDPRVAFVLAAVVSLGGPTVVGPIISMVRPTGAIGPALRAEGILIDPIGASCALIAFELALLTDVDRSVYVVAQIVATTLLAGVTIGLVAGLIIARVLRQFILPEHLVAGVVLVGALVAFIIANNVQAESGLLAITILGMVLGRRAGPQVDRIEEFLEGLRPLLIGTLFLLLASRVALTSLLSVLLPSLLFVPFLIVVVRPLATLASTAFSPLSYRERAFVAFMAPRGIVAAAVSAAFGLRLETAGGLQGAELLAPIAILVVISTVVFYGLIATPLADKLTVSDRAAYGPLIVGAHPLARGIASHVEQLGMRALIVDTDLYEVVRARRVGLEAHQVSAISDELTATVDFRRIGVLLAMSSSDEVNTLAVSLHSRTFGRGNVYQLLSSGQASLAGHLVGRLLPGTYTEYDIKLQEGWSVALLSVADLVPGDNLRLPMLWVMSDSAGRNRIVPVDPDRPIAPPSAEHTIALVAPHISDSR